MRLNVPIIVKVVYLILSLSFLLLLMYDYNDYSLRVYSIKHLKVEVKGIDVYVENHDFFLNLTYSLSNGGVKCLEVSMITYKTYFGSEVARVYNENFYGSLLVVKPSQKLLRTIIVKVPGFKLKRNLVNGTVRVSILFNVYIRTRFGNTPVSFQCVKILNFSKP